MILDYAQELQRVQGLKHKVYADSVNPVLNAGCFQEIPVALMHNRRPKGYRDIWAVGSTTYGSDQIFITVNRYATQAVGSKIYDLNFIRVRSDLVHPISNQRLRFNLPNGYTTSNPDRPKPIGRPQDHPQPRASPSGTARLSRRRPHWRQPKHSPKAPSDRSQRKCDARGTGNTIGKSIPSIAQLQPLATPGWCPAAEPCLRQAIGQKVVAITARKPHEKL